MHGYSHILNYSGGKKMNNVNQVNTCPACKAESDKCKVVSGEGYFITIRCTECGCEWNTLNFYKILGAK